jgi:hypothetical protein
MLRSASTAILILAGGALAAVLVSLLTLRLVVATLIALSGARRSGTQTQVLGW